MTTLKQPIFKPTIPPTKTIVSRGAKIRYSDIGKGRAVVLLHGFPFSLDIWFGNGFANALAKKFRVITIDLPGHGKSECIGYVQTMERMADVVKDVMDEIGLRRYVVVGHSMGGYVALAFAEKYADNLRGLCLFHSLALPDSEEKKLDRDRGIKVAKRNLPTYTNALVANLFAVANQKYLKKEISWVRRLSAKTKKQGLVATIEGMKIRKNRELILKFADFPIMFIAGKRDNIMPFEKIKDESELPKKARFLPLDRVGHMGFIEMKETTLKKLKAFSNFCFK